MNTPDTEWDNHEHIRSELGDYCNLCGEPMPPVTEIEDILDRLDVCKF